MKGHFWLLRVSSAQHFRSSAARALLGITLIAAIGCLGREASSASTPSATQSVQASTERSAPVVTTGTFTASRTCPLYQSKRNKTNPGHRSTTVGAHYAIRESQKGDDGSWYRVQTDAETSPLRWVSADCGATEGGGEDGDVCHLPGHQDSNVLALSWQPGFCAHHKEKLECREATPHRYDATHFTLHGLWPNQRACNERYGYCGDVHNTPSDFCSYPEVPLTAETRKNLGQVMPSVAYGTCLERHEWWKHGTCWTGEADAYFIEALRLVQFINESPVVTEVLHAAIGKSIDASALQNAIDAAFGSAASKKFELDCNQDHELVEVRVSLPANVSADESLPALLQRAPNAKRGCTGRIQIVAYGN